MAREWTALSIQMTKAADSRLFEDEARLQTRAVRRILIISDAWAPQVNGVVRTYENICRQFDRTDCDIRVIGPADFPNTALPSYPEIRLALPRCKRGN